MASFRLLILFAFALGTITCTPHGIKKSQRKAHGKANGKLGIYGGIPTTVQRHPFMAAIHWDEEFMCAGTIIGDQWVITSALCMDSLEVEELSVITASNDAYNGDAYKVDKLIFHPKYDAETMDYQYALIKVNQTFKFKSKVKAIKLPEENLTNTTKILVSGWGYLGDDVKTMQQGGMKWMPNDFCKSSFTDVIAWTDRMACAYNKGKTTLCGNDYGDPIVYKGVLYGIFIMGYPANFCSSSSGPIMLADVHQAVEWIKKTMKEE